MLVQKSLILSKQKFYYLTFLEIHARLEQKRIFHAIIDDNYSRLSVELESHTKAHNNCYKKVADKDNECHNDFYL